MCEWAVFPCTKFCVHEVLWINMIYWKSYEQWKCHWRIYWSWNTMRVPLPSIWPRPPKVSKKRLTRVALYRFWLKLTWPRSNFKIDDGTSFGLLQTMGLLYILRHINKHAKDRVFPLPRAFVMPTNAPLPLPPLVRSQSEIWQPLERYAYIILPSFSLPVNCVTLPLPIQQIFFFISIYVIRGTRPVGPTKK